MNSLYVDHQGSRLGFENNCLVLTPRGEPSQTFPCRVVSRLIIIGHVHLTPALLDSQETELKPRLSSCSYYGAFEKHQANEINELRWPESKMHMRQPLTA